MRQISADRNQENLSAQIRRIRVHQLAIVHTDGPRIKGIRRIFTEQLRRNQIVLLGGFFAFFASWR